MYIITDGAKVFVLSDYNTVITTISNLIDIQKYSINDIHLYSGDEILPLPYIPLQPPQQNLSGTFYPTSIEMVRGSIKSNPSGDLQNIDNVYLIVQSVLKSNYYYLDWNAVFKLPGNSANRMITKISCRCYPPRFQSIFYWNYLTNFWDRKDQRNIFSSVSSFELASPDNVNRYISDSGEVKIRFYIYSTVSSGVFTNYVNQIKLEIT